MLQRNGIFLILFVYLLAAAFIIYHFHGTGDSGDSPMHYLFAKYAPQHPELYFNHWAKPFFVLVASPFAQFGFVGIKVFNALVVALTALLTYRCAELLLIKNNLLVVLILLFSPLYFILTFSALTEPLFALFIAAGLYAVLKHKLLTGAIIISLLPFIRSEGLIILGVFGFYFIVKKQWKALPYLALGHLFYAIAGYAVYKDLLWIFKKIPYAQLSSIYGEGELTHFVEQLYYVVGFPIYILFWLGSIAIAYKFVRRAVSFKVFILVFLGFFAFFAAHTLFWYLGIFNSMGLKRVLIGVMPLLAIIAMIGFNFLTEEILRLNTVVKKLLQVTIVLGIIVFPFTQNHAAIHWKTDLSLTQDQEMAHKIAHFVDEELGKEHRFIFAHPYLNMALGINPFDKTQKLELQLDVFDKIKQGDIIIWDSWFSVLERGITKESLNEYCQFVEVFRSETDREASFIVYQWK